ncbi:MAG TPA: hypothetical protein VNG33_19195 [Polyangiaceae bacterium]|nr:hypothetical protein [Polyangiaceae bacterium]
MTHCERCGHGIEHHDDAGNCSHAVDYGRGACTCDNYLRAVTSVPELLASALHAAPGRDATGLFYSSSQARLVARYAEALLDNITPPTTISATELLEGWRDGRAVGEVRWFSLSCDESGQFNAHLYNRPENGAGRMWTHTSLQTARDAAAKAIMKAGQDGCT